MTSKVIDGSFPPYERVIPRENKRVMMLDNSLFGAAVDRVATISNEQSRAVKLSVETGRPLVIFHKRETSWFAG